MTLAGTDLYISDFSLSSMLQITEKTPLADLYNKARAAGLRTMLNSSKASIGINGGSLGVKAQLGLITDTLDVELAGRPGSSECHGTVTSGKKGKFLITADEAGKLFAEPEKKPEDTAEKVQEEAPAAPAAEKPGKDAGKRVRLPLPLRHLTGQRRNPQESPLPLRKQKL